MLILRVGDPHVQYNNVKESDKLFEFVLEMAIKYKVDRIELLGDLLHTHAQIRLEVLEFWDKWLHRLAQHFQTVVLVGNHDQSGAYNSNAHSLSVFDKGTCSLHIVSKPWLLGDYGYIPYIHDRESFVSEANKLTDEGAKVLVCHQTFTGGKYESGIYAPDGIEVDLLKAPLVISGHLHTRQRFGKVIYPGTARWLTSADANEHKGLWLVEHSEDGLIKKEEFLDTSHVCTPIVKLHWSEGQDRPIFPNNAKITVELIGSSKWINKQKALLKNSCSVTSKVTDTKRIRWKPEGKNTLETFINQRFEITSGLNKEKLLTYFREELELV